MRLRRGIWRRRLLPPNCATITLKLRSSSSAITSTRIDETVEGAFPAEISPHQPFKNIAEFSWTLAERLLIAGRSVWFYLEKLLMPLELTFFYEKWELRTNDLTAWIYPLSAAASVALLWRYRGRVGRGPSG